MLEEKFETFTFSPARAAVYHLGNFGTAREKLESWELVQASINGRSMLMGWHGNWGGDADRGVGGGADGARDVGSSADH